MFKAKGKVVSLLTACLTALFALVLGFTALFAPTPITTASAATETSVTLAIKANKGTLSGSTSISWTQGKVTFTNVKGSTAIRTSDSDHYRAYANSTNTISVSEGTIKEIVITCTSGDYANVCKTSATNAGATVSVSGSVVTITPPAPTGSNTGSNFTFTSSAQWRLKEIVVTYKISDACTHENATENITTPPTCTTAGVKTITCTDCNNVETKEIPATGHNFVSGRCSVCGEKEPTTKTDVLNRATTDAGNNSTYVSWSGKTATTNAVYAGNSAGSYDSIQLRSNNSNSGIVTTTSGGNALKITVEWNSNTTANRTLQVYGKNTPYEAATDLYNTDKQGTLLGTIVYGTGNSTELEITGDYAYIGLRSADGAMYLTSVSILWETNACDHANTSEVITTPATCTTVGEMTTVCDECETVISTAEIPATGHSWDAGVETTPPQAGVEGVITYTCQNDGCGETKTDSIPALDAAKFVVRYSVPAGIDAIPDSEEVASEETIVLAPAENKLNFTFVGWTTEEISETMTCPEILDAGSEYVVLEENAVDGVVTLYALYTYGTGTGEFTLLEDASELAVGKEIVIVANKANFALSTTQNGNNRAHAAITKNSDNTVTFDNSVQIITLEEGTVDGTFAFNVGNGYLYAASSSSNHLKTQDENNNNGSWAITIDNGIATIKAQGEHTRNWLKYNSTNNPPIFSCYASGQADVSIYMKDGATYYTTNLDVRSDIYSANATVEADITMNYYVELSDDFVDDTIMQFTVANNTYEATPVWNEEKGKYMFSLPNIAPHLMTETIIANLIYNETVLDTQENYSVKQYIQNLLTANQGNTKLVNFLTAMLYYGDAAQVHENAEATTSAGVTGIASTEAYEAFGTPDVNNKVITTTEGLPSYPAYLTGVNVWFAGVNKLTASFALTKDADVSKVSATIQKAGGEAEKATISGGRIYSNGISTLDFGTVYTIVLYYDGTALQTVTYSIYTYATKMYAKDDAAQDVKDLVLALYRYGKAAEAFNAQ